MAVSPSPLPIVLQPSGWTVPAEPGQTILAAALAAGVRLPNSCRNGVCRTCLCRLQAGTVDYVVPWPGLTPEEKREGWILPCVARPLSALTLETPQASRLEQAQASARATLTGARR